jgi:hypothetical protein
MRRKIPFPCGDSPLKKGRIIGIINGDMVKNAMQLSTFQDSVISSMN